jgi:AraC-like DNA-binding protein
MVSLRCKLVVRDTLDQLGIRYLAVSSGTAEILGDITEQQRKVLGTDLLKFGLELLDDKKTILIETVKNLIIDMIHYSDTVPKINYSEYLSQKMGYDYTYLSNVFSEVKGTTIEQYIIANKIERAKELLLYDELNMSEIADKLHYSSVAHLSNQFKKVTGLTPTYFKQLNQHRRRIELENL